MVTKAEWFRSMFGCSACMSYNTNWKLCNFHQDGKKYIELSEEEKERIVDDKIQEEIFNKEHPDV